MLQSLAFIFIFGALGGYLLKKCKLPGLVGMLIVGILIGPYCLNMIDSSILSVSAQIRKIALIIILTRAGLTLDLSDLKQVGRPAILLCFVPASFEMLGMVLLAPKLLGVSVLDAAIMGAVVAAVSPAVVVPGMIKLMDEKYGTNHSIPQMILAGASVDDVYVIVMFTAFTSLASGNGVNVLSFVNIPVSVILGVLIGIVCGKALVFLFNYFDVREAMQALILLSISFLLVTIEDQLTTSITFSSLLAIMVMAITIRYVDVQRANRLIRYFNVMWIPGEILLFVLVGACVNIQYAFDAGIGVIVLIFLALIFRMIGVGVCVTKTKLTKKEKLFTMLAYTPKATVQAAIGGLPLAMGLSCGNIVLTVAVIAILITAPLGATLIDKTYKKLLTCGSGM